MITPEVDDERPETILQPAKSNTFPGAGGYFCLTIGRLVCIDFEAYGPAVRLESSRSGLSGLTTEADSISLKSAG